MATPTPAEIRAAILQAIADGVSEIQIGDRRIKLMTAQERMDALKDLENSTSSPFIKVGFRQRTI
jgi:hypothetical protein